MELTTKPMGRLYLEGQGGWTSNEGLYVQGTAGYRVNPFLSLFGIAKWTQRQGAMASTGVRLEW